MPLTPSAARAETVTVGAGKDARPIALLLRDADPARGPDRPALVWLGGYRSDMTGTKAVEMDALAAERGLAAIRFDYSGHGASGGAFRDGTISRWLEEALAVLDHVGPRNVVLVGSSMGGWIALRLAQEIARLHRSLGATMVYVTHDQVEAMTMADRIVVMKDGAILQIGTPTDLYDNPADVFTASFIGSPSMNLLRGRREGKDVVPHKGDSAVFWDTGNWQSLCGSCHNASKRRSTKLSNAAKMTVPSRITIAFPIAAKIAMISGVNHAPTALKNSLMLLPPRVQVYLQTLQHR